MTGFGSGRAQVNAEEVSVEIRSVNGKFCEAKVRLPRELQSLEAEVVREVKARLARGTVDVSIRRGSGAGSNLALRVDEGLAERAAETLRALRDRLSLGGDVTLPEIVAIPGVISMQEPAPDLTAAGDALTAALDEALERLIAMREVEGRALREDLERRLGVVAERVASISEEAPTALRQGYERLRLRVEELAGGLALDPARLAQEVALLAERSDIAEELTRLDSHLVQFRSLLESDEPSGRRMDFLIQELNREANTIASKSNWAGAAAHVVELKAEIERIREQIQNVE
ncbi:YicC/YloC family endoribonuclease [Vulgatibacter incomptus]|uniref:YicC/YloC family endoribonuclease n=1 Tax=Vulgatibacter incomptus TaxID=1391653 RepID=UPI0030B800F6